jgi:hypothetical protein
LLIDQMLRADLDAPRKQRHTVKRIFDRLVNEHQAEDVTYPMVRAYVPVRRSQIAIEAGRGSAQAFIVQSHQPGAEAEVDFGDVKVRLAGELVTGLDAFYCRPGIVGAHKKGGVEGQVGWFRRNHMVPVPEAASLAELNAMVDQWDEQDEDRGSGPGRGWCGSTSRSSADCCSRCRTNTSRRGGCSPCGWTGSPRSAPAPTATRCRCG